MLKHKVMAFILLMMVFISARAYGQQGNPDQKSGTVAGTVTYMDTAGGVIKLQTDMGMMVFYISVESDLFRFTHHIASIEIEKGDPVIAQYTTTSGKNVIVKLIDSKPEKY